MSEQHHTSNGKSKSTADRGAPRQCGRRSRAQYIPIALQSNSAANARGTPLLHSRQPRIECDRKKKEKGPVVVARLGVAVVGQAQAARADVAHGRAAQHAHDLRGAPAVVADRQHVRHARREVPQVPCTALQRANFERPALPLCSMAKWLIEVYFSLSFLPQLSPSGNYTQYTTQNKCDEPGCVAAMGLDHLPILGSYDHAAVAAWRSLVRPELQERMTTQWQRA